MSNSLLLRFPVVSMARICLNFKRIRLDFSAPVYLRRGQPRLSSQWMTNGREVMSSCTIATYSVLGPKNEVVHRLYLKRYRAHWDLVVNLPSRMIWVVCFLASAAALVVLPPLRQQGVVTPRLWP